MSANPKGQSQTKAERDQNDELKRRARRRLVGSAVLFLTAIVVVPAVIETEPSPTQSPIELRVPDRPSIDDIEPVQPPVLTNELDFDSLIQDQPASTADAPQPAGSSFGAPANSVASSKPTPKPKPKPSTADQPAAGSSKSGSSSAASGSAGSSRSPVARPIAPVIDSPLASGGDEADPIGKFAQADVYWVQVVAVRDKKRAQGMKEELNKAGFEARIESVSTDQGMVYRVRVGPLEGQDQANQSKSKLKAAGYDGRVVQ